MGEYVIKYFRVFRWRVSHCWSDGLLRF